jgi:dTDP-4-amino-4,6-dideoxygalactose transaminase
MFVDCESACFNLDLALAEDAITKCMRVIMPVCLYGHRATWIRCSRSRRRDLCVVVDAATARLAYLQTA